MFQRRRLAEVGHCEHCEKLQARINELERKVIGIYNRQRLSDLMTTRFG